MSKYLKARGKPRMERVLIPSLFITYPPYSENLEKGLFLFFLTFPLLDKRKVGGDSCLPQHLQRQMQNQYKQSVLPPYHRTEDSVGERIPKKEGLP